MTRRKQAICEVQKQAELMKANRRMVSDTRFMSQKDQYQYGVFKLLGEVLEVMTDAEYNRYVVRLHRKNNEIQKLDLFGRKNDFTNGHI